MKVIALILFIFISLNIYGQEEYLYTDSIRKFSMVFPFEYSVYQDTYRPQDVNILIIRFSINSIPISLMVVEHESMLTFEDSINKIIENIIENFIIIENNDFILDSLESGVKLIIQNKYYNNYHYYYFINSYNNKYLSFIIFTASNSEDLLNYISEIENIIKTIRFVHQLQ